MLQNVLHYRQLLKSVKQTLVSYTSAFSFVPSEASSELELLSDTFEARDTSSELRWS